MKRYELCFDLKTDETFRVLPRSPFRFRKFEDTTIHTCREGEMLWEISAKYYHGFLQRPSMWYWVIADFQPKPILDVTIGRTSGEKIYIPSVRVIEMYIQDTTREPEFENF